MDLFSNTMNRFKILNVATVRGPSPPDPLRGARDSLLVARCRPPPNQNPPYATATAFMFLNIKINRRLLPFLEAHLICQNPLRKY